MIPSVISNRSSFRVVVFDGVKNMKNVRNKVTEGKVSASLVSPRLLCHTLPILIAIEKSIQSREIGKMITRTIFTEVLYNLSFTKNITESLKTFGVKEEETSFLAVLFNDSEEEEESTREDKLNDLKEIVEYKALITDVAAINSFLSNNVDVTGVRKVYKIKEEEFRRFDLNQGVQMDFVNAVIARVSSKGISI